MIVESIISFVGHDKPYATILQKADFKVVNESECKRHWLISDEMNMNKAICTEANKGVDACSVGINTVTNYLRTFVQYEFLG